MLETAFILSLQILGIRVAFLQGAPLGELRIWTADHLDKWIGRKWSMIIQKPVWSCYPCMSSVWTIVLSWSFSIDKDIIPLILLVCGISYIIDIIIPDEKPQEP